MAKICGICDCLLHHKDELVAPLLSPSEVKWVPPSHCSAGKTETQMILAMTGSTVQGRSPVSNGDAHWVENTFAPDLESN